MDAPRPPDPWPQSAAPADEAERRSVGRFDTAILVRAVVGTALWVAVHRDVAMTAVLVASCWGPWIAVRRGARAAATDRERARGHILNASLVVLLATAAWTIWGLVLAGRGRDVEGPALAALWAFLLTCFVVDFWLFRWGLSAIPSRGAPPPSDPVGAVPHEPRVE